VYPQDQQPTNMIVAFSEWTDRYDTKHLKKYYSSFEFGEKGVALGELEGTLDRATVLNSKYIGQYTKIERIKNIVISGLLIIFSAIAISIGMQGEGKIVTPFFLMLTYLVLVFIAFYAVRRLGSKFLRDS
jgi:hypothetical protein